MLITDPIELQRALCAGAAGGSRASRQLSAAQRRTDGSAAAQVSFNNRGHAHSRAARLERRATIDPIGTYRASAYHKQCAKLRPVNDGSDLSPCSPPVEVLR